VFKFPSFEPSALICSLTVFLSPPDDPVVGIFRDTEGGEVNQYKQFITFLLIIAFKISYIETNNHRYTVHKDFTWKPKWEKTTEHFSNISEDYIHRKHQLPRFSSTN
jgi:hypothetical protein